MGRASSRKKGYRKYPKTKPKKRPYAFVVDKYALTISRLVDQVLGHRSPVRITDFNRETKNAVRVSWLTGDKIKVNGKSRRVRHLKIGIFDNGKLYVFNAPIIGGYTYEERDKFSKDIIHMMKDSMEINREG